MVIAASLSIAEMWVSTPDESGNGDSIEWQYNVSVKKWSATGQTHGFPSRGNGEIV